MIASSLQANMPTQVLIRKVKISCIDGELLDISFLRINVALEINVLEVRV